MALWRKNFFGKTQCDNTHMTDIMILEAAVK